MKSVTNRWFWATTVFFPLLAAAPPALTIDYPAPGALFPPDFAPPTILWHDSSPATAWRIRIGPGSTGFVSRGPVPPLGPIDPDCVSSTNKLPQSDPTQHSWVPTAAEWDLIQRTSPAVITITGLAAGRAVSRAELRIETSKDQVGAPIFYRDVPLMPVETTTGTIQPLSPYAVRLVKWRVRDVSRSESRVVLDSLPVCANCHSFSADGKSMGMDLDGLHRNKGRYFVARLGEHVDVKRDDVIQWTSAEGRLQNAIRVGFMSQLSPDGSTVVTTTDTPGAKDSNYYVANFTDYRFLQVFFPTRGRLAWYRRDTGILQPLPGAADPASVHFGAVWTPDGQSLVFARAQAREPNPPGHPVARKANDPNELQIQYDLCRIPFDNGRGGQAVPIAGTSASGMSNTFPKVSPDGRWLVYVQARNGQLLRPDSQLYIVPLAGGTARRMRCNTTRMNSWHSFSPNGRWLVFSSKARSPYTQMYLTHIDEEGNDTPPVLIESSTAANRAVNLPEFVNVAPEKLRSIDGPALEYYRLYDRALYLEKQRRFAESADLWQRTLDLAPDDTMIRRQRDLTRLLAGRAGQQSAEPLRRAAWRLATGPQPDGAQAIQLATKALSIGGDDPAILDTLAAAYAAAGRLNDAIATARRAVAGDPGRPEYALHLKAYQGGRRWSAPMD